MESDLQALFETESGIPVRSVTPLYREGEILLADVDGDLYLWDGSCAYRIGSHPYEPCTYLLRGGGISAAIHNAFEADTIRFAAESGETVRSITGNDYGIGRICRLLVFAAKDCPDSDIGYVEGRIAIEKMKELGATSPETAVRVSELGVRGISDRFSRSKKRTERVLYTEDGRAYVRIKER